jgi:signal transduction histidine kinase
MAWRWGISLPAALLFSCITIVLSGMLLDPGKTLYMAAILIGALFVLQTGFEHGTYHPDLSWSARSSNYGDVVGYGALFAMLALVSWLFGREIVRSFERAEQAEAGLLQEKLLLETRVIERTAKLRVMQLEKVQQLHRFAELGQLSTAMMHELANRLTSLSLDIETLHGQQQSDALQRAQTTLRYIDTMTRNVSKRLHGLPVQRPFDVTEHTKKVIKSLDRKSAELGVDIQLDVLPTAEGSKSFGDSVQFAQVMSIVLTNALESYDGLPDQNKHPRTVLVEIAAPKQQVVIRIVDHGRGIAEDQRHLLFKPFNSNKKQSMGVGLYIAKTILKTHFNGEIRLDKSTEQTEFVVILPIYSKQ